MAALPDAAAPRLVFTGKMDYRPNIDAVLWFAQAVLPCRCCGAGSAFPGCRHESAPVAGRAARDHAAPLVRSTTCVRTSTTRAVYVIPMRVGGGARFKALEAMASGAAIVSTEPRCRRHRCDR